jgi:4'-phosphopantetheinyl transferase
VSLGPRDADVWLVEGPEDARAGLAARCATLLSPDETARMLRYRQDADRRRHLFAHALARVALSAGAPEIAPATWRFVVSAHGRPEIAPDLEAPPLRFNLSHTRGLVVCAVTRARDVGVDVEHLEPSVLDLDVAAQVFAPAEASGLWALAPEERRERFFTLWTLKEAYIKARGLGLAIPLQKFAFNVEGGDAPRIAIAPELNDDPGSWHFQTARPTPRHVLSLAVRREAGRQLRVRVRDAALLLP